MSGCRMMGYSAGDITAGYFDSLATSIGKQEDPEMVRQGFPSLILLVNAMLEEEPENSGLLRAASTAYATYAQAFLVPKQETARAVILYARAKECGLKLLRRHRFYAEAQNAPFEEYEKALSFFGKEDVPDIYAAANAWLGWILNQPDSMAALADLPKALALMQRALELDDTYSNGGAHLVFGIYYAIQPSGAGRDMEKSKMHFKRALELSGEGNKLPQVIYAEFYAVTIRDEELFSKTLDAVLEKDPSGVQDNTYILSNAIARERARELLKKKEDYF